MTLQAVTFGSIVGIDFNKETTTLDEVLISMFAILELGFDGLLNASQATNFPAWAHEFFVITKQMIH